MRIDFHTHTFPEKIAAAALSKLSAMSHTAPFTLGTDEDLRRSMKTAGIDLSVVLPVATNPEKISQINQVSLEKTGKEGLIYFGCVHPDSENALEELERVSAMGLRGIKIHPVYQGVDIDDLRFLRILEKAGSLDLVVVMHAGDDIGFPGVVHCSPEQTRRALLQVRGVRLVLAHMGGWQNWERVAENLADTDAYLDTSFSLGRVPLLPGETSPFPAELLSSEDFCSLVRSFGSHRVLFGSDSPWTDQKASLEDILTLPLTWEEKESVLGKNAERLLRL